ncbi:MAG: leucine-rich repeat protein [Lachnospiraceae bacterium]|nr:leucine-rich repeat protein [Lachnospiraceae bacterium]
MKVRKRVACSFMILALIISTVVGTTTVPTQAASSKVGIAGKTITSGKYRYKVISVKGKKGMATLIGAKKKKVTSVKIPEKVKSMGYTLTVTGIGNKAFKNDTKLKIVTTNSELTVIGGKAFSGCSKLNKIHISSKKLKSVGKNALKGISKKAVIEVPGELKSTYIKLLSGKGQTSTVKIQALDERPVVTVPAVQDKKKAGQPQVLPAPKNEQSRVIPVPTEPAQETPAQEAPGADEPQTLPADPSRETPIPIEPAQETPAQEAPGADEPQTLPADPPLLVHQHNYSEWETTVEATCVATGTEERECITCGAKETRSIAKKTEHTLGAWYTIRETSCVIGGVDERACLLCGVKETRQTQALPHTLVSNGDVAPTCTARGQHRTRCSVCGQQFFSFTGQALGHNYAEDYTVDVAATCLKTGSRSRHCLNAGCDSKADVIVIPATGHQWGEYKVTKEPDCTACGSKFRTCDVCKTIETASVQPLGHDYDTKYTVDEPATCTEVGWESIHCRREGCNGSYMKKVIPYASHKYEQTSVTKKATCVENGEGIETCTVCRKERTVVIPSVETHNWGEEPVVEYINECRGSNRYKECVDCGKRLTLYPLPGKGHNWTTADYVTAKCADCGISAPNWTNEWARTHCESEPPYGLLPECKARGEKERTRVVWIVWFKADTTMSEGFHGEEYAGKDGIIDADYKFSATAPKAKDGYEFVGWVNAGTGDGISKNETIRLGWEYMDVTVEAKYQPVK